jgi:hypothetical protein
MFAASHGAISYRNVSAASKEERPTLAAYGSPISPRRPGFIHFRVLVHILQTIGP